MWFGWCYGLGMYGVGVSWIFISIYEYGHTSFGLALVMIALFIMFIALLFAFPFYFYGRWLHKHFLALLIGLPALWVASEWIRTWLFTGFPWLYLGYAHIDTWLSGWAPVSGVIAISFIVAFSGAVLVYAWENRAHPGRIGFCAGLCVLLWLGGLILRPITWTEPFAEPVKVGMAQGNIPQEKKMDPYYIYPPIELYAEMTQELWERGDQWIIWPEAAIPLIMNYPSDEKAVDSLFAALKEESIKHHAALILGIRYYAKDNDQFYNAIVGLGLGTGIYFKQRLVPFGEYVPFERQLRGLINFFNLPTSIVSVGPYNARGLQIGSTLLSPSICYEIVYPDAVAKQARNANALITISNDAWFGDSLGPLQHLQIAQMRALETGRYLIRSTNNGVSAFVDDKGHIISKTKQFVQQTLEGEVELRRGQTPFMRWRSGPIVLLAFLLIALNGWLVWHHRRNPTS